MAQNKVISAASRLLIVKSQLSNSVQKNPEARPRVTVFEAMVPGGWGVKVGKCEGRGGSCLSNEELILANIVPFSTCHQKRVFLITNDL